MITRYTQRLILDDLKDKMVFISGPRQVGKTTLSLQIADQFFPGEYGYMNWDNREDRRSILGGRLPAGRRLLIYDEIHKYRHWKNYLKGVYDKHRSKVKILVTGSARLDIYKKGGDSLLGRYHAYRLHPLSSRELLGGEYGPASLEQLTFSEEHGRYGESFDSLFKFGGFPELAVKRSERELRRWHNERADRLIKEDIRDMENLRDLSALQVLVELLPDKVGSLFSVNSLREDLSVTHKTIASWIDILERFYYHFRIYPFRHKRIRSLRKEPKLYLWDWSEIKDEDARLENMVASHLLKLCHFLFDARGYKAQLHYLRDRDQREADFLVTIDNRPWFCVETKRAFKKVPAPLTYFGERLKIPLMFEVVKDREIDFIKGDVRVISADRFLSGLV